MLMDSMPIAVIMQRRLLHHPWMDDTWSAIAVVPDSGGLPPMQKLRCSEDCESYLVSGLQLELHRDGNDAYFENWNAPEPKVFVMWRMQEGRAIPLLASVSYVEGTRMFDSGESADGVPMPAEIHLWLGRYLQQHYQPRQRRGREHG
ncbi:DUF3305 domain-containing protein [Noviherbaspirillum massiliense]|uniref:DUF3305 domain-containing protein n=1 Tax=Noviherbaspirillum massiliense TaxID=1465823 RepID=UPI0002E8B5D1|nr:DUF3305 domain-containing protein [Noviherbaspirillum massiliense]